MAITGRLVKCGEEGYSVNTFNFYGAEALNGLLGGNPIHSTKFMTGPEGVGSMPDIDLVIAWVDGSDPKHAAARRRFQLEERASHSLATHETRFQDNGEIYYLIASVIKYSKFFRHIYIVSDDQKPEFLDNFYKHNYCERDFIEIISHDIIFRDLKTIKPTFNSRTIEAAIWRIPGLCEHFVYANDDMFLNAPLRPEDFFREGKPVLHGKMLRHKRRGLKMRLRNLAGGMVGWTDKRPKHLIAQETSAVLAGMADEFFHVLHQPHPLRRSTIEKFYGDHEDILRSQMQFRFRDVAQHWPIGLANSLEIIGGNAIIEPTTDIAYMTPDKPKSPGQFLEKIRQEAVPFGCMQSLEEFSPEIRAETHRLLREKFADVLPPPILQLSRNAA